MDDLIFAWMLLSGGVLEGEITLEQATKAYTDYIIKKMNESGGNSYAMAIALEAPGFPELLELLKEKHPAIISALESSSGKKS